MSRTFTAVAGAVSISEVQRQAMKTSDGLYFLTSDGLQMYVKISETAILLLNNIYTMNQENRSFSIPSESRSYVV